MRKGVQYAQIPALQQKILQGKQGSLGYITRISIHRGQNTRPLGEPE